MKQKAPIAILIAIALLMLVLLSSLLVRGCPSSRHGYQTEVPVVNNRFAQGMTL